MIIVKGYGHTWTHLERTLDTPFRVGVSICLFNIIIALAQLCRGMDTPTHAHTYTSHIANTLIAFLYHTGIFCIGVSISLISILNTISYPCFEVCPRFGRGVSKVCPGVSNE